MKKLYAPWRSTYVHDVAHAENHAKPKNDCVFCQHFSETDDEKNYIIKRFNTTVLMLNLYPYNAGHLMVLPLEHLPDLVNIPPATRSEIIEVVTIGIELLKTVLKPQGFNIGLNLGLAGGGGIPSHLHYHILPRWNGDTNFLPLLSDTKVVSVDLEKMYADLKEGIKEI